MNYYIVLKGKKLPKLKIEEKILTCKIFFKNLNLFEIIILILSFLSILSLMHFLHIRSILDFRFLNYFTYPIKIVSSTFFIHFMLNFSKQIKLIKLTSNNFAFIEAYKDELFKLDKNDIRHKNILTNIEFILNQISNFELLDIYENDLLREIIVHIKNCDFDLLYDNLNGDKFHKLCKKYKFKNQKCIIN